MIAAGAQAPDFALPNQSRETVRLSDFRGRKHVVLAFHPLAFTPICSTQAQSYERERGTLDGLDAEVLVISTDNGPSKRAWAEELGTSVQMLSDFFPQGEVSRAYGVMGDYGLSERAVVVVDKDGVVRWTRHYGMEVQPPVADVIEALRGVNG
ncbi:MAG: redoxin domain-containing protein [Acidobacteria bacterium]|nr:redoxin domain-containing protein [Acidobacteriota bacterium]